MHQVGVRETNKTIKKGPDRERGGKLYEEMVSFTFAQMM